MVNPYTTPEARSESGAEPARRGRLRTVLWVVGILLLVLVVGVLLGGRSAPPSPERVPMAR